MGDFIQDLNPVQQEAVKKISGPSLIIAGAGSGKTRVLTYRIAWLLKQGIPASSILALTFTNKAAAEMKERVSKLVGFEASKYVWMGTFHSIFSRILRSESKHTGYSSNFTVYDTIDSRNVLKKVIKELKFDEQLYKPKEVLGRISRAKNNLISAAAYSSHTALTGQDSKKGKPRVADIFMKYQNSCRTADAMDFDDLLLNTNILFRDYPGVLKKYQDTFRYILVDEYQDTNYAQYLILSRLAEQNKNISVVGDDAQSIYAFRGARIENILNFKKDYPEHRLFKLEQNYRSTKTIVGAANSLISKNLNQIKKKVWSAGDRGEKLVILECATDHQEGALIAKCIEDKKNSSGCEYTDFAVLYRTNSQSRIFEETLRRMGIPYKVYGSLSFYQRKEIKDLLAYFRLALNNRDQEAFYRIINYPARGIGKNTTARLAGYCNQKGLNPWDVICDIEKHRSSVNINKGASSRLTAFYRLLHGFSQKVNSGDAWQIATHIASASGILKDLFDPGSPENVTKYENIQELLNAIKEFTVRQSALNENTSLAAFLQNVSLLTDQDTEKPDDHNKVKLMTVHSAKGLEFKHIYVGGLEEELFPNAFSAASPSELEEERRLFYVALTRAVSSATLSYAQTRYRWGAPVMCRPSRFLSEIDPQYLAYPDNSIYLSDGAGNRETGNNKWTLNSERLIRLESAESRTDPALSGYYDKSRSESVNSDLNSTTTGNQDRNISGNTQSGLHSGMIVEHERFGRGKVISVEGHPPNTRATVHFTTAGQKQLLLKFAKLKVIPHN